MTANESPWLDYHAAGRYVGLSRSTLERLVADKRLAVAKVGRLVRIHRDELDRFMKSATVPAVGVQS